MKICKGGRSVGGDFITNSNHRVVIELVINFPRKTQICTVAVVVVTATLSFVEKRGQRDITIGTIIHWPSFVELGLNGKVAGGDTTTTT